MDPRMGLSTTIKRDVWWITEPLVFLSMICFSLLFILPPSLLYGTLTLSLLFEPYLPSTSNVLISPFPSLPLNMALYVFGGEGCGTLSKQSFTTSFHLYILLSFLNEIGAQRGRT
jgi:hypothetical protein